MTRSGEGWPVAPPNSAARLHLFQPPPRALEQSGLTWLAVAPMIRHR
jgi:hypothetical protein